MEKQIKQLLDEAIENFNKKDYIDLYDNLEDAYNLVYKLVYGEEA